MGRGFDPHRAHSFSEEWIPPIPCSCRASGVFLRPCPDGRSSGSGRAMGDGGDDAAHPHRRSRRRGHRRISHNATHRPSTLTGLASMGATGVKRGSKSCRQSARYPIAGSGPSASTNGLFRRGFSRFFDPSSRGRSGADTGELSPWVVGSIPTAPTLLAKSGNTPASWRQDVGVWAAPAPPKNPRLTSNQLG